LLRVARRGTVKRESVEHEEYIARHYNGTRTKSSGAVAGDEGDVRTPNSLIECKTTGSPSKPLKKKPVLLDRMEKINDEAQMDARHPLVCQRYYWPESPLANRDGYVDLVIKRLVDDA
jgi:hypothetical protein